MGTKVIIMIFALLIIVGSITLVLKDKQIQSTDDLYDTTMSKQVKTIANTFAHKSIRDLFDILDAGGDYTTLNRTRPGTMPNSFCTVYIAFHDTGVDYTLPDGSTVSIAGGDYLIIATATLRGDNGITYTAETRVLVGAETQTTIPLPPAIDEDPELADVPWTAGCLTLEFADNVINLRQHPGNSQNPNNWANGAIVKSWTKDQLESEFGTIVFSNARMFLRGQLNFDVTIVSAAHILIPGNITTTNNSEINLWGQDVIAPISPNGNPGTYNPNAVNCGFSVPNQSVQVQANLFSMGPILGNITPNTGNTNPNNGFVRVANISTENWLKPDGIFGLEPPEPLDPTDPNNPVDPPDPIIEQKRAVKNWRSLPAQILY